MTEGRFALRSASTQPAGSGDATALCVVPQGAPQRATQHSVLYRQALPSVGALAEIWPLSSARLDGDGGQIWFEQQRNKKQGFLCCMPATHLMLSGTSCSGGQGRSPGLLLAILVRSTRQSYAVYVDLTGTNRTADEASQAWFQQ